MDPSVATPISMTRASRSSPSPREVRSVESLSGSMGKISAAVYTEVVLVLACRSIGDTGFDDRIDVRNRDQDFDSARREPLRHGELVQISRRIVVDRAPEAIAEVANRVIRFACGTLDAVYLLNRIRRKVGFEPAIGHCLDERLREECSGRSALSCGQSPADSDDRFRQELGPSLFSVFQTKGCSS